MDNDAICISEDRYLENLDWASRSYHAALKGTPVPCRGCNKEFSLLKLFRCYHCGSYFCPACSGDHFGERDGHLFQVVGKVTHGLVVCRDFECQSRSECHHSQPHVMEEECCLVCGADEPYSRCFPVDGANG